MTKIHIITDSGSDLPQQLCDELGIHIIPLYVMIGDDSHKDRVELQPETYYPRLKGLAKLPTTSQPTPGDFRELFSSLLAQGGEILCLTISSGLSGTYQSAITARDMLEGKGRIEVIDTMGASIGQGLLAVEAARLAAQGKPMDEILPQIRERKARLHSIFTIDTLENLVKGGRVSAFQGGVGALLDIKPILHLNQEGKIVTLNKVRSRKKALAQLDAEIEVLGKDLQGQVMGVSHAREPELAAEKARILKEKFGAAQVIVGEIGAVIGTHTGQGCVAVFFYGDMVRNP